MKFFTSLLVFLTAGLNSGFCASVDRVELVSMPNKTVYAYGDSLVTDGAVIAVGYADGTTRQLPLPADSVCGFNTEKVPADLCCGISIDCARKYCSVDLIKAYIDSLASRSPSFLTLHFADNENVGVECAFLGQTAERALMNADGSFTNPATGLRFLSRKQVEEIVAYADDKKVQLIPELDMPGHMGGFFKLAKATLGDAFLTGIAVNENEVPGELNITRPEAVGFASDILSEYMDMFDGLSVFCIGADEFWTNYGERTIAFINNMNKLLKQHGFTTRIYNDLIRKEYVDVLDHDIQVLFWSHDGATNNLSVRDERKRLRASLPDLQYAGFPIVLTNSYYLYFVPSPRNTNEHDLAYTVNDIKNNWTLAKWDNEYPGGLDTYKGIVGTEVALWQENASEVSDEVIIKQMMDMYDAMTSVLQSNTVRLLLTVNYGGKQTTFPVQVMEPMSSDVPSVSAGVSKKAKVVLVGNVSCIFAEQPGFADVFSYEGRCLKSDLKFEKGITPLNGFPSRVVLHFSF